MSESKENPLEKINKVVGDILISYAKKYEARELVDSTPKESTLEEYVAVIANVIQCMVDTFKINPAEVLSLIQRKLYNDGER